MELYLAICIDHHIDEHVRAFSTFEKAMVCCTHFMYANSYEESLIEDVELTNDMMEDGWLYYATYGTEGDSVRIEFSMLDEEQK